MKAKSEYSKVQKTLDETFRRVLRTSLDSVILEGISKRGKRLVSEHGELWIVFGSVDDGEYAIVPIDFEPNSFDNPIFNQIINVKAESDKDFRIVEYRKVKP